MRFGVMGAGPVGQAISARLAELGHEVMLGTRKPEKLMGWQKSAGEKVKIGSFAESTAFGEMLFNATNGEGSLSALNMAGEVNLNGKVLIDISNPLDTSMGMPPSLFVSNTDSLGEQIQHAFPKVKVVKTLNTMNNQVMVRPRDLADGDHHVFLSGDDAGAKAQVAEVLKSFGWVNILDLGDITTARGAEMYMALWLRLWGSINNPIYNIKIVFQ